MYGMHGLDALRMLLFISRHPLSERNCISFSSFFDGTLSCIYQINTPSAMAQSPLTIVPRHTTNLVDCAAKTLNGSRLQRVQNSGKSVVVAQ